MFLLIHTALEHAQIAVCDGDEIVCRAENLFSKEHASWLHPAIHRLMESAGIQMARLKAIAVTAGPGSYTGLRVGMAAAKGLCFALQIPLITVSTLQVMAEAMIPEAESRKALISPLLDARRQEVYAAVYSANMQELLKPCAMILDKTSFDAYLAKDPVIFFGNGAEKWRAIVENPRAIFVSQNDVIQSFARIVQKKSAAGQWSDTAYVEPIYLKEFYTHAKN